MPPLMTESSVFNNTSGSDGLPLFTPVQQSMIKQLEIENIYLERKNHTLRYAYSKYKEFCRAHALMKDMQNTLTWKGAGKQVDLKGIFASPSYFYSNYEPFKFVAKYPSLIDWLENNEDCLSDDEIWGFSEDYNLGSVQKFLHQQGELEKSKLDEETEEVQKQTSKKKGKSKAIVEKQSSVAEGKKSKIIKKSVVKKQGESSGSGSKVHGNKQKAKK